MIKQWTRGVGKLNGRTTDLFVNVGDVMSYCRCRDEAAAAAGSRIVLMFWHDSIEPKGKPTLDDAGVLAAVRRLKNIPQPKPIVTNNPAAMSAAALEAGATEEELR